MHDQVEQASRKETPGPIVVRLTPPGVGAVAVVLVEGPRATEMVAACFSPRSGRGLHEAPIGRIVLGRWGGPEGEELIVCRRRARAIEVHPHGGRAAVERVVHDLAQHGALEISWKEWALQYESCPIRAAARIALADAPTLRTAAVLLDQFHGALRRDLELAIKLLAGNERQEAANVLAALAGRSELGRHLVRPWRVVLTGPPNVGKSSLTNALVGYERAIVHDQPGTTRDVVTVRTAIDGWPVELCDTAGLRQSSDALEAEGVRLAQSALDEADLVVYVLDATQTRHNHWEAIRQKASRPAIVAVNKIDLVEGPQRAELLRGEVVPSASVLATSAVTREGVDELLVTIAQRLVPNPPESGAAVPFERRHGDAIDAAIHSLAIGDDASAAELLQGLC
jgi:tRNA modification GTPase